MKVFFSARARLDLLDIWLFIAEDSIDYADRWREEIQRTIRLLADQPEMGRKREEVRPGLRSFPVGDYVIFYRIAPDGLEIVRVYHGARDLRRLLDS